MDNYGGSGFSGGAQYGANYVEPDPSQQIMVRNVGVLIVFVPCCYSLNDIAASMVHRQRGFG